jgi:hypothetical protein
MHIDIFINCNWVLTRWQYTFTHEHYTEQHKLQPSNIKCGPFPDFVSFTLAFALQLRKKYGKTSDRVRKTSVRLRKTSVRLRKTSVTVQYTYYQKQPHVVVIVVL